MDNLALLHQSSIAEDKLKALFQGHTNNRYENLTTKVVTRSDREIERKNTKAGGAGGGNLCNTVISALSHSVSFLLHSSLKATK